MKTPYAKQPAFTIVELLITIVVIGILAAISMVAYSGIQMSAKNVSTERAVAQYEKALAMYVAQYGQYPTSWSSCLGETTSYPEGCFSGIAASTQFANELRKVASLPPPPVYECFTGWGECRRNFTFVSNSSWQVDGELHRYYVIYFLGGNAKCKSSLEGGWGSFSTSTSKGYFETRGSERMCVDMLPMPS